MSNNLVTALRKTIAENPAKAPLTHWQDALTKGTKIPVETWAQVPAYIRKQVGDWIGTDATKRALLPPPDWYKTYKGTINSATCPTAAAPTGSQAAWFGNPRTYAA